MFFMAFFAQYSIFIKKMALISLIFLYTNMTVASEFLDEASVQGDLPKADMRLSIYTDLIPSSYVFLLPIFPSHSSYLYSIYTNKEVMKYYGYGAVKSIPEIDDRILQKAQKNIEDSRASAWLIITHYGAAGQIGITSDYDDIVKSVDCSSQELSYAVSPKFSGRGIATMASKAAMTFIGGAFHATTHPKNKASISVLRKLGFTKDESRSGVAKYNSVRDYFIYSSQKEF